MAQADRVADMGTSRPAILEGCYLLLAQMPADPGLLLGYSLSAKANMLTGVAKKRASGKRKKTGATPASLTYASDKNQGAVQMTHRGRTLCF